MARVLAEALAAVEDEFRLEVRQFREQGRDVVADSDHQHVMAARQQRARDVVLRFLRLLLNLPLERGIFPLGMKRIEDHRDLHTETRSMSPATVFSEMRITRPPSSPTAGSSSIAVRRSPVRSDR